MTLFCGVIVVGGIEPDICWVNPVVGLTEDVEGKVDVVVVEGVKVDVVVVKGVKVDDVDVKGVKVDVVVVEGVKVDEVDVLIG